MADTHSKDVRSYNMSQVKNKNTQPEMLVRKYLFNNGFRYRLHDTKLPGKPDIILPKYKTVIFVHGCFWHGHQGCKYYTIPKTRTEWWQEKISKNIANDERAVTALQNAGWRIIIIWGCELKTIHRDKTLLRLVATLKNA